MIQGDRVRLRAIEKEDLPAFVNWLNDPEVRHGLSRIYPLSLSEEKNWYQAELEKPPSERSLAIEIQPEKNHPEWIFVGSCGYLNLDWRSRCSEIGLQIGAKQYWNQGFGTRTVRLLVNFGFREMNLNRLWLRVHESNSRAIRAYQKAGFIQEGRFRQGIYLEGNYEDVMIMSMLKSEWIPDQKE